MGQGQYGYEPPQSNVKQRFTGKDRDDETGLDWFSMRYYGSNQGRFVSPDPLEPWMLDKMDQLVFYSNPQKLNKYVYVLNNPLRYIDPDGLAEIPPWGSLNNDLQQDLLKRGVNKETWDGWNNDQRQTALNARALLISLDVWNHVTSLAFSKFEFKENVTHDLRGNPRFGRDLIFSIDNKSGWRIALTTDTDTKALLSNNPKLRSESAIWNHPEGLWTYKEKGDDIVMHFVGIRPPWEKYTQIHTDAGGGSIFNAEHRKEVSSGTGSSQDRVSAYLGKNPSTRKLLVGISPSLDKVLDQKP
jgi:RHS repeat-associated protein